MDTDVMEMAFEEFGIRIPTDEQYKGRQEKANHILSYVITNRHQRIFMLLIQVNKETKFDYLRRRLDAYTKVYQTGEWFWIYQTKCPS